LKKILAILEISLDRLILGWIGMLLMRMRLAKTIEKGKSMIKVCVVATFEIEVDNEDEPDRLEDLKRELEEQITNDIVAS